MVTNAAGDLVVTLGADDYGDGLVRTKSAKGKYLVQLSSANGGEVSVFNKAGESIAQMSADEYGNGRVARINAKAWGER